MGKLVILTNSVSGIYNFRKELVMELLQEGHEVAIAGPRGDKEDFFEALGCRVVETAMERRGTNPMSDLTLLRHYRRILKKERPQLVLTYTIKPNIYGGLAARSLGIPYMANITGLGTAIETKSTVQKVALLLYRVAFRKASCVFFQNEENLAFFRERKLLKGHHRRISGSGVNLMKYRVMDYPGGDTVNFFFISRVMREKGIEEFLEAAETITRRHPETRFHVLGFCEEDYEERLRQLEESGVITYHGYQEDMLPYYRMSHCTIHPTFYPEGMSNVLLESAASGRPVITTNRTGCREIVEEGVNGFFTKERDAEDLVRQVERFLSLSADERKAMGLAGRRKVEDTFDREKVIAIYMEEVAGVLRKTAVTETEKMRRSARSEGIRRDTEDMMLDREEVMPGREDLVPDREDSAFNREDPVSNREDLMIDVEAVMLDTDGMKRATGGGKG